MIARLLRRSRLSLPRTRLRRHSSEQSYSRDQDGPVYRVNYVRPVIWSAAAITAIYVSAAAWELAGEIEAYEVRKREDLLPMPPFTYFCLELLRMDKAREELIRRDAADVSLYALTSPEAISRTWNSLTPTEKAAWTAIGINTALYLPSKSSPSVAAALYHLPAANRNWTLLTSTFGHGGPLHLLINMYVLNNFALPVSQSKTFRASASHGTAFYLSAGILSALAYHLQSAVKPMYRMIPCLGASGAIYGMVGLFGMSYPDAKIGIILLPFSFPAQQALIGIAAFELWGTIYGTRLGLAHVSHLAGLAAGSGYVYFDAGKNVWERIKLYLYNARAKSYEERYP